MPGYAPGMAFARSREAFAGIEEWLEGPEAAGLEHAERKSSWQPGAGSCCGCSCRITWTRGRPVSSGGGR